MSRSVRIVPVDSCGGPCGSQKARPAASQVPTGGRKCSCIGPGMFMRAQAAIPGDMEDRSVAMGHPKRGCTGQANAWHCPMQGGETCDFVREYPQLEPI